MRKYTFSSGCKNIPSEKYCNAAGGVDGYSCMWQNGKCNETKDRKIIETYRLPSSGTTNKNKLNNRQICFQNYNYR